MKKLIAMVMTAAMVASLVPATAFAAGEVSATAKIVDALELTKDQAKDNPYISNNHSGNSNPTEYKGDVPELQLKITNANYKKTNGTTPETEVTLELDNADWFTSEANLKNLVRLELADRDSATAEAQWVTATVGTDATHYVKASLPEDVKNVSSDEVFTLAEVSEIVTGSTIKLATNEQELVEYLLKLQEEGVLTITQGSQDIGYTPAGGSEVKVWNGKVWKDVDPTDSSKGVWSLEMLLEEVAAGNGSITKNPDTIKVNVGSAYTSYVSGSDLTNVKIDSNDQMTLFEVMHGFAVGDLKAAKSSGTPVGGPAKGSEIQLKKVTKDDSDEITFVFSGEFAKDDVIIFDLESVLDKTGINRQALVSVSGDLGDFDDLVYVSVLSQGITATTKKVGTVAVEEHGPMSKDLVIKSNVGNFANGQVIELKLSNGFEFYSLVATHGENFTVKSYDEDFAEIIVSGNGVDKITIAAEDIEIEASSAKADAICNMTVKSTNKDNAGNVLTGAFAATAKVEVIKVVDYVVELSVDEDEDVPVIYNGVNVNNYGITDDSDHFSLEVTAEETFPGAWSMRKGFNFELPAGVYVTDVDVTETDNFTYLDANKDVKVAGTSQWLEAFWDAYQNGDHKNFEFDKRVFNDVNTTLEKDPATVTFQLELVADPDFVGDVTLKLTGDLVDEQEVTIAKFVSPYTVKAEQNDIKIDYRNTPLDTKIVVTEAEAGLWDADKAVFNFKVDRNDYIEFDGDPEFTIDSESGLKIKDEGLTKGNNKEITFTVDKESSEPATVTIEDMELFLDRTIPAGAYDLDVITSMNQAYLHQVLFAPDEDGNSWNTMTSTSVPAWALGADRPATNVATKDSYVDDVTDFDETVKEAFVNVVTAGREQDDASFTTKVVVPVGESKIMAGETEYTIDAPAYINANGYTMLPVRAVAVALGINNNNVLWDQATKTVTILYGQRIITMQVGASVVYVNGAALPASSSVEITNNRTFLGLRDLATALGVTDITWDASTKTATLNGGNTAE